MMVTSLPRLVPAPPALSLTPCRPCPSQQWPPPSLILTWLVTSLGTTSHRYLATSPQCRASGSHHRLHPLIQLGGLVVEDHPPPTPLVGMKTSLSPPLTSPPPPPVSHRQDWTTPAAPPPSLLHLHPQLTDTSPSILTPTLATSHLDGTFLLYAISPPKGTWVWRADIGEICLRGEDPSLCCPQLGGTTNVTCPHEGATGA